MRGRVNTVSAQCQNPDCMATWGVPSRLDEHSNCVECGAEHLTDFDGHISIVGGPDDA